MKRGFLNTQKARQRIAEAHVDSESAGPPHKKFKDDDRNGERLDSVDDQRDNITNDRQASSVASDTDSKEDATVGVQLSEATQVDEMGETSQEQETDSRLVNLPRHHQRTIRPSIPPIIPLHIPSFLGLSIDEGDSDHNLNTPWLSKITNGRYVIRTYSLSLTSESRKAALEAQRLARAAEDKATKVVNVIHILPTEESLIEVILHPRTQRRIQVEEAHLYLSPRAVGTANHSVVYVAEWELPLLEVKGPGRMFHYQRVLPMKKRPRQAPMSLETADPKTPRRRAPRGPPQGKERMKCEEKLVDEDKDQGEEDIFAIRPPRAARIADRSSYQHYNTPRECNYTIVHWRFSEFGLGPYVGALYALQPAGSRATSLWYHGMTDEVEECRAALERCPPGHSLRSRSLNNLANSIGDRFMQRGFPSDLDESVELHRAALLLRTPGHSDRSWSLNGLAISLGYRFTQRGIPSDLDECIELHRAALLLRPPDRFMQRGVPSDLDESIEHHRAALLLPDLRAPGHSLRSYSLINLAISLQNRFMQLGVPSDLDESIELHQAALLLRPPGHSDRWYSLNNLALSLRNRFTQHGIPSDLDECIEFYRAALLLCPPGHSLRSESLNNLAGSLLDRFRQRGVPSDLDETFNLLLQLPHISHAVSRRDLTAAKSWATAAEETNHGSALLAYQTALKFLDQHVTLLSSSSRHFDIRSSWCAETAVELVEQGRAVFWTQLVRLSSPFDGLSLPGDTGRALAEEFEQLSFRLRSAFDQSTEDQSPQIRQLTIQWSSVVSRIRMLPELSRFLLPPLFSDLQKAAEEGPVVIVNASQYSCDALIVLSDQNPARVPIHVTRTEVSELSSDFQSIAEKFGCSDHQNKLVGILRKLWHDIVDPVVQALRMSNVHPGSRIWWCPTADFTLLPLHAAGPYERDSLSQIYISSYAPTLATLVRARQRVFRCASTQNFVAIGQGNPDGGKELRCVAPELAAVAQRLAPIMSSFTSLEDSGATVKGVLDALNHNQWLHLACHGMPNRQQPFEYSFAMRDGPLMIKNVIRSNCQNPEFAFLSACHTTVGDEKSPDESIHLAAAMQFSGFRSVIGSMWSVDDEVARQVVSAFYDKLVDDSGRLDCTRAAVALHKAVRKLRCNNIPLEQQIVFVHIGV
ncbi:CHAT domain-containing protein [Suillus americanus]|nr:CHAT domain-containing protein [Suillus americanus]